MCFTKLNFEITKFGQAFSIAKSHKCLPWDKNSRK